MTIETDVLVVGAGPAGLTMAAYLATYGIDAITVTRYAGTANAPRAHITNQRTFEVFRDLGIEDRVISVATPSELMSNNVWATSFAGQEIARLQTWGTGPDRTSDYEKASPSRMWNAPQHILEPVLMETAQERGADIRFRTELVAITQDEDGVTAAVVNRDTGREETIRAKYVVAADGARSLVAHMLDFPMKGEIGLGSALNIWVEADLTRYTAHRPGVLYWMAQPGNDYWVGSGTWINVKPFTEWVVLSMYDPAEGEPDTDEGSLLERIHRTIGDPSVKVTIKSVSKWQINHMVAETYQMGRVFLAGDAAHRHPPANGLGSNTSIQDSFNLAWKLAKVLTGQAAPVLLESYDAERQPVGQFVVDRALQSVADMAPISASLGFRPGQSSDEGWASLAELFSTAPGASARRAELAAAVALQNYQFNALGVELGQRYESAAVLDDGQPWPAQERDPQLYYEPTTHPGSTLPHVWVQHGTERLSSLDVVGHGSFTLITGIDDSAWRDAADAASASLGMTVQLAQIAERGEYDDVLGAWARVREISDSGCLLVRPDRFVAWRQHERVGNPTEALTAALRAILGRQTIAPAARAFATIQETA